MNITHLNPLRIAAIAAIAVMAVAVSSCDKKPKSTASSGIATIACDASFENIIQQEIDVFEFNYKQASIIPYYIDERACIDSLLDLGTKLAVTTRPLTDKEEAYLKSKDRQVRQSRIAVDALALIESRQQYRAAFHRRACRDTLGQGAGMEQRVAQRRPRPHRGGI